MMKLNVNTNPSVALIFSSWAIIWGLIFCVNIGRFLLLDPIPDGFNVDEIASGVTIQCLATEKTDAAGNRYPLFSDLGFGNPKPPVYVYPGILWTKIFGFSIASFRAFTVFGFSIGLIGLFFLAKILQGRAYATWAVLIATLSPWTWFCSRIAYDSPFCLPFLIWGLYFIFRPASVGTFGLAGACLSGAMYAYPPLRLFVPLLLGPLGLYTYHRQRFSLKHASAFVFSFLIVSWPLAQATLSGKLLNRFNEISIFAPEYWKTLGVSPSPGNLVLTFLRNVLEHVNPKFLWMNAQGQKFIHGSIHFGILGWLEALSLLLGILIIFYNFLNKSSSPKKFKIDRIYLSFLVISFFIGIIPSAMTNAMYGIPNSLRALGAWPFACLFFAYWIFLAAQRWPRLIPACVLTAVTFAFIFLCFYFGPYSQESKFQFNYWQKRDALAAKTAEDQLKFLLRYRYQNLTCEYYMMNYFSETCSSSRQKWETLRSFMSAKGIW